MSQKLCERCHIRPATVVIRAIAPDGSSRSHHLCQECAGKMFPAIHNIADQENPGLHNVMPPNPGNDLEDAELARELMELLESAPRTGNPADRDGNTSFKFNRQELEKMFDELNARTCPKCGMSSAASLKSMKLGCRECLDAFREDYRKLLEKQQQEQSRHRRESTLTPLKSAAQEYLTAQIELLEDKLANAVKSEEYEQAAVIKQKIQALYNLLPTADAAAARGRKQHDAVELPDHTKDTDFSDRPLWLPPASEGCRHHIRLRSFVRYERNLAAVHTLPPYTESAHATDAAKSLELLLPILRSDPLFRESEELDLRNVTLSQRRLLYMAGVAPWDFLNNDAMIPSRIFITGDRRAVALINSRAHLSVTIWNVPDLKSESVREIQLLDKRLSARIAFACDAEFGAITRDIASLGSGVTIGEVLHLPLLALETGCQRIANGCKQLGCRLRVSYPGDTTSAETYSNGGVRAMEFAAGGIVNVTDAFALGNTLNERCRDVQRHAVRLANHELELRRNLGSTAKLLLKVRDLTGRCAALINGAALCSPIEFRHILSALWLGMELGMFTTFDHNSIFETYCTPGACDPAAGSDNANALKRTFLNSPAGGEA